MVKDIQSNLSRIKEKVNQIESLKKMVKETNLSNEKIKEIIPELITRLYNEDAILLQKYQIESLHKNIVLIHQQLFFTKIMWILTVLFLILLCIFFYKFKK